MAAVVSIASSQKATLGTWLLGIADVTMDASYPTGGEVLAPADFNGITTPYIVLADGAQGYHAVWDYTNKKLLVYSIGVTTGSTAAAGYTNGAVLEDLAGAETVLRISGTAIDTTYDLGPLKEVPNTSDLSAVKFRVIMIGE